jgi:hypothetical protein
VPLQDINQRSHATHRRATGPQGRHNTYRRQAKSYKQHGLQSHTQKCIFIGYPPEFKGWLFYNPETKKTLVSNAAVFDECSFPGLLKFAWDNTSQDFLLLSLPSELPDQVGVLPPPPEEPEQPAFADLPDPVGVGDPAPLPAAPEVPAAVPEQHMPPQAPEPAPHDAPGPSRPLRAPRVPRKCQASSPPPNVHCSTRNRQPPQPWWEVPSLRPCIPAPIIDLESSESPSESSEDELDLLRPGTDDDHDLQEAFIASVVKDSIDFLAGDFLQLDDAFQYAFECAFKAATHSNEPCSYKEAMCRPDSQQWHQAAVEEIEAHLCNGTWILVQLPPDRKAISFHWVFKVKRNADGSLERYKARLVAKGFSQHPGLDYTETFRLQLNGCVLWRTMEQILWTYLMHSLTEI